jgi:DNA adenine methylase Dam
MIETPFNYTGSKFRLLEQLLPEMDYTKSYFVDLFCGGGSVYSNVVDKYDKVIANDIISDLIGIHKSLLESDDIIEETKSLCLNLKESQEEFLKLRKDYNDNPGPAKLWSLMLSCNSNLIRFNQKGKFNQTWGKRSWNSSTEDKTNEFIKHIRQYKDKIHFSHRTFNEISIPTKSGKSDKFMFYCDPPYAYTKNVDGTMGNKQISEAGYNNFYYKEDDLNLYNYCHKINDMGSSFMISGVIQHGGNRSWILDRLISDGFRYKELDFDYKKINKSGIDKKTKEIIIMNY